jgi:3-deoxy-7-phosphoheptulonate synthase
MDLKLACGIREKTIVDVNGLKFGKGFAIIAGPCSIEDRDAFMKTAQAVAGKAGMLRGGAFKPRSSPYSFQGIGEEGLKLLKEASDKFKMPVVTECMEISQMPLIEKYAGMIQIGARNMQNFNLLKAVGKSKLPVLLKRGMAATIDEWLASAEYIMKEGNHNIVLCERGIRSFDSKYTRNVLDLGGVAAVQKLTHLPVIVDPSHASGRRDLVIPLSRAAKAVGADGVIVEVHAEPENAKCDGEQSLTLEMFDELIKAL